MTIPIQGSLVYGPIHSRRFGTSLGINILPVDKKICSFDCVYCQYGETKGQEDFPDVLAVQNAVETYFKDANASKNKFDWIMLAGNGEPTLHPDFGDLVDVLLDVRNRYLPGTSIGILSNSSRCFIGEVMQALSSLDGRFMKLDAGSQEVFDRINRPCTGVELETIVEGLKSLSDIELESMFITGSFDNTDQDAVDAWIDKVKYINPKKVRIYSVSRETCEKGILPVTKEKLEEIATTLLKQTNIPVDVV